MWRAFATARSARNAKKATRTPTPSTTTSRSASVSEDGVKYGPPLHAAPDAPATSWDAAAYKAAAGGACAGAGRAGDGRCRCGAAPAGRQRHAAAAAKPKKAKVARVG